MILSEAISYVKHYGGEIGKLVKQGDKEALKLFSAYTELYKDQRNEIKQTEFCHVCSEYMKRDLNIQERARLAEKFGHKVEPQPWATTK